MDYNTLKALIEKRLSTKGSRNHAWFTINNDTQSLDGKSFNLRPKSVAVRHEIIRKNGISVNSYAVHIYKADEVLSFDGIGAQTVTLITSEGEHNGKIIVSMCRFITRDDDTIEFRDDELSYVDYELSDLYEKNPEFVEELIFNLN